MYHLLPTRESGGCEQPIDQSVYDQSVNQPVSRSIKQLVEQPVGQAVKQQTSHPNVHQSSIEPLL